MLCLVGCLMGHEALKDVTSLSVVTVVTTLLSVTLENIVPSSRKFIIA